MVEGCGENLQNTKVAVHVIKTSFHFLLEERGAGDYYEGEILEYTASDWSRNDKLCGDEFNGIRCYHLDCARRGGLIW